MARLNNNGASLFYEVTGSGPPVLLLHSLGGSVEMWRGLSATISSRYTVIALDARGHGKSELAKPFTVEQQAADAAALLDYLGVSSVRVLGLSMGGQAALHLTKSRPQLVAALGLANTSLGRGTDGAERRASVCSEIEQLGWNGYARAYIVSRTVYPDRSSAVAFEQVMKQMNPACFVEQSVSISRQNVSDAASQIAVPTLVASGDRDDSTPPGVASALAEVIKGADVVTIPDAGHLSVLDQPAAFAGLFMDFFDRVDSEAL